MNMTHCRFLGHSNTSLTPCISLPPQPVKTDTAHNVDFSARRQRGWKCYISGNFRRVNETSRNSSIEFHKLQVEWSSMRLKDSLSSYSSLGFWLLDSEERASPTSRRETRAGEEEQESWWNHSRTRPQLFSGQKDTLSQHSWAWKELCVTK